MAVSRFGVSIEQDLLEALDVFVENNNFPNRSQAIRHILNNTLVEKNWEDNKIVAGSITLVYDHHRNDLLNQLNDIQHDYHDVILSSLHFHLDHHNCMEIVAFKGQANMLKELGNKLKAIKGIQHSNLSITKAY